MSDTNTPTPADQSRRRLLKALGIAGTGAVLLPGKWFQPIVDTIISPAEAGGCASGIAIQGQGGCYAPSNVIRNVTSMISDSTFA